jgi:phthalate 4,5-dioxygenase
MSIAARRNYDVNTLYWRVNQFMLPFYTLVPPLSPFPDLSGHAWVPIDDENTLCIMFSYHPSEPLRPKTRQIFAEGHNGRESGHASRNALVQHPVTVPYAGYWTKYHPQNGFQFDYESQRTTWFSGLPGLWVQDGACQSGVSPIFDRTKETLCSSDTGIAMTRRFILEALGAYRDHGTRPKGVTDPDVFMVRAVSLRLPPEDSWAEAGAPFMQARLGADFGYEI